MLAGEDTIAAISTPQGAGGIGIVRVSGPYAEKICRTIFKPLAKRPHLENHRLYHGDIVSSENKSVIDEVLVSIMRKPHSYTGEDLLEINCHGGPLVLQAVLSETIKAGARLAEPGEFTRRAFLNNRIDLMQAEAVINLITAKTDISAKLALSHIKGDLSKKILLLRSSLVDILATLETSIDFTEEDTQVPAISGLSENISDTIEGIEKILSTYEEGRIYKDGLSVVIAGRPNVGKSSLMNRLAGRQRSIVTHIPGTTRDWIEETVNIGGIPVNFADTAGIRDTEEIIEKEGMKLTWEKVSSADLVIVVLDGSADITGEDLKILDGVKNEKKVPVINKCDLPHTITEDTIQKAMPDTVPLWISAKYDKGISELKKRILSLFSGRRHPDETQDTLLTNLRHKTALEKAVEFLVGAKENIACGSCELAAFDIREALENIGEITGETTNDEILDRIFSNFCVGK